MHEKSNTLLEPQVHNLGAFEGWTLIHRKSILKIFKEDLACNGFFVNLETEEILTKFS